jgi:hypothetical protein
MKQSLARDDVYRILTSHKGRENLEKSIFDIWVHSDEFILMEFPLILLYVPKSVESPSYTEAPIIVDANLESKLKTCLSDLIQGRVISIVDGYHRVATAKKKNDNTISAYVGRNAIIHIETFDELTKVKVRDNGIVQTSKGGYY